MGTKRVLDDSGFSQSSEERLLEDAQKHSPDSDGEDALEPESPDLTYRVWWARLLRKHARAQQLHVPDRQVPIRLVSGCSGCCAEAAALKARFSDG